MTNMKIRSRGWNLIKMMSLQTQTQAHLLSQDDWEELLLASDDEEVQEDDGTGTRQRGRK